MLGSPVDLSKVDVDSYVVAGIDDHIVPWPAAYRSTQLLGGNVRFVLSTSGHVAAMVNPPSNPKATYRLAPGNPGADPAPGRSPLLSRRAKNGGRRTWVEDGSQANVCPAGTGRDRHRSSPANTWAYSRVYMSGRRQEAMTSPISACDG